MPGTTRTRVATAATPTSAGCGREAHEMRSARASSAPTIATAARPAARLSANCGLSLTSSPSTKPMPLVLASTHPTSAPPLMATPARLMRRPDRPRASAPHAIWSAAVTEKATTAERGSLCAPAAAAWMAPAPSEAMAAAFSAPGTTALAGAADGAAGCGSDCRGSDSAGSAGPGSVDSVVTVALPHIGPRSRKTYSRKLRRRTPRHRLLGESSAAARYSSRRRRL